jgi:CheY-like chemotaxis protein
VTTRKDFFTVWLGMSRLMVETAVILMAEDDENQVVLMRRVFKQARLLNPVHVVKHGEEAIAYLKGEGQYANREEYPLPALLLLDLKMPRKNGFEVLKWIREQPSLCALRVIVLTSSEEMADVNRAYQLGANSFLVKPADFEKFVSIIQTLQGYWLWMNETPEISRSAPETKSNP